MALAVAWMAVLVSVVGWVVMYMLTVKAQDRQLVNQLLNQARVEITKAIRDYQDWLGEVHSAILTAHFPLLAEKWGSPVDWLEISADCAKLFYSAQGRADWASCLEEYHILFPDTGKCRVELLNRHMEIHELLTSFLRELDGVSCDANAAEERRHIISKAQAKSGALMDQTGLMQDILVHLQNRCLGHLTGARVPDRQPKNVSSPVILADENGTLRIVPAEKARQKNR